MLPNPVTGRGWVLSIFFGKFQLGWIAAFGVSFLGGCGGGDLSNRNTGGQSLTLTLPSSYSLKWSDEFSTAGAPGPAWAYDLGTGDLAVLGSVWGNSERQYYTDSRKNSYIRDGVLIIQPIHEQIEGAPGNLNLLATSARLKTDTDAFYRALNPTPYGFYEIRAKVPCIQGAWSAVWMLGRYGSWPARGEIDIMEWFGKDFASDRNQVSSAVHTAAQNGMDWRNYTLSQTARVAGMCDQFNNFQMHWTSSEIVLGVNGVPTFRYKRPANATPDNWPFDQPAYLILNVAVGGTKGGVVNPSTISAMALKVEHVRIWQP